MSLYGLLSEAVFTAARPFLNRKYAEGNDQRYGCYPDSLAQNAVWIHAVSVGEVQSAYPFIREIRSRSPEIPLLLSTITKTGKTMSEQLMGDMVSRIYYPWDAPSILKKTLRTLSPRAYVNVETEIWPEMLHQLQRHGIPSFLVNGRLSEKSLKKYCRLKGFWGRVIRRYTLIMTRTEEERERFIELGALPERVRVTGDCKVDALINRKRGADTSFLDRHFTGRPVILAGSTHEGEDEVILDAYASLLEKYPSLQLVIAPRHPERAQAVADLVQSRGIEGVTLYTQAGRDWKVMVIDRIGVLFSLYSHVTAAFIGGSLVPRGGQNIMEPAIWGIPFCQGPDYHDFTAATEKLVSAGMCSIVNNASDIAEFFDNVLRHADHEDYKSRSREFFDTLCGASRRSWDLISSYITV